MNTEHNFSLYVSMDIPNKAVGVRQWHCKYPLIQHLGSWRKDFYENSVSYKQDFFCSSWLQVTPFWVSFVVGMEPRTWGFLGLLYTWTEFSWGIYKQARVWGW